MHGATIKIVNRLRFLATECICMFRGIVIYNTDYFRKQLQPFGLYSVDGVCSLFEWEPIFKTVTCLSFRLLRSLEIIIFFFY